ncbi:hypothetical protein ACLKA7_010521 [Drosophila subpalustris]
MLPPILECGIFEVTWQDGDERVFAKCWYCSPRRQYRAPLKQTGSLHNHVRNLHPELKYKIEERKKEQQQIRKEARMEMNRLNAKIKRKQEKKETVEEEE